MTAEGHRTFPYICITQIMQETKKPLSLDLQVISKKKNVFSDFVRLVQQTSCAAKQLSDW